MNNVETILKEYDVALARFRAAKKEICGQLENILNDRRIISSNPIITSRVKERNSLRDKIITKASYNNLTDVTDILGFRVIVYLENDVDKVLQKIEENFVLDRPNCVDKRKKGLEPFGYQSVHYVVSAGNSDWSDIRFEIQVRSVLQHAWAEIEHDLGYKGSEIPVQYTRDFSRVAALLETADYEFTKINRELTGYKRKVKSEISQSSERLLVDKDSLSAFKQSDEILKEVRSLLTLTYRVKFVQSERYKELIDRFKFLGINKINELRNQLEANRDHFLKFVEAFMQERNQHTLKLLDTSPLFYIAHFLAASKGKEYFRRYRAFKNNEGYNIISKLDFCHIYEGTKL